ncbi:MAG: Gfo/Idh/MocA family oxidoreductase [Gammaproteobacteria bacterium]|nr:Gfo/Idh/MocA family oxidoreductase [Gammaproteobacteria bacterium]
MTEKTDNDSINRKIDLQRRRLLQSAASAAAVSAIGLPFETQAKSTNTVRWGFIGTGMIANSMAHTVTLTPRAKLVAVSSRRLESARSFAEKHGASLAFDSWTEMFASGEIDAIYVATPTSVREEISVAAAQAGKHVLAEKPFASLLSMQNIIAACRENNVGFMDGTHFVHHPRTHQLRKQKADAIGWAWSVASAFQFNLTDKRNIRYNPELEPMGAIGDAGWYNMRAAVEYLAPDAKLESADAHLRRDTETGAALSGSGVLRFTDGSTSTWNCGFDSGAVVMDLRVSGTRGAVSLDDFLSQSADGSADYLHRVGGWGPDSKSSTVKVDSSLSGSALMFEDFATMVAEPSLREPWASASIRTQTLLDAVWRSAINNE